LDGVQREDSRAVQKFDEYNRYFLDTPGWFDPNAIATWDALLDFQEQQGIEGNFLEIGVFQGKSAGMAALHAQRSESCIFIDMLSTEEARERIRKAVPQAKCEFLRMMSSGFRSTGLMKSQKDSVRWIHIDGGHSASEVEEDLRIANSVMQPLGVVVLDDFFSPAYPQIVQAMFRYMDKHPNHFSLFLSGHNKGYLCRPAAARMYLRYVKDRLHHEMEQRGCGKVTLWKTTTPNEINAFGSCPQSEEGLTYRGLDTDHSVFAM
jgi:hypothetical protein